NSGEKFLEDFYDIPGWRRPMRLMLIVATVAVAMLLDLRVSQATQMPWCAGTTKGDFFSYNCTLPTYEMCVQEVIAGNRGMLRSEPVLPRARIRAGQGQTKAMIHASSALGADGCDYRE